MFRAWIEWPWIHTKSALLSLCINGMVIVDQWTLDSKWPRPLEPRWPPLVRLSAPPSLSAADPWLHPPASWFSSHTPASTLAPRAWWRPCFKAWFRADQAHRHSPTCLAYGSALLCRLSRHVPDSHALVVCYLCPSLCGADAHHHLGISIAFIMRKLLKPTLNKKRRDL